VIAHWDEVKSARRDKGEMAATWQRLGDAAGTVGVGVTRIRVDPDRLSTPPHSHAVSEELVYVLEGAGLVWQDEAVFPIRAGDCVVFRANEAEHTLRGGPDGLDVLVYGTRHPTDYGWLPRSNAVRLGWPWVEGRTDDPWDVEAQAEPLDFSSVGDRPANVVHLDEVEGSYGGMSKALAAAAGSEETGLNWLRLEEGQTGAPPHCHSEDEEVFVVLEGEGTLELWPSPVAKERGIEREDVPVRAGEVIARPPGTRIGHAFRGGAGGTSLLVYGTRRPNDIAYYPRSNKIYWRGIGVMGRVEHLDYFDGEPGE
jgi:uncharacterized cupin superfamily protein